MRADQLGHVRRLDDFERDVDLGRDDVLVLDLSLGERVQHVGTPVDWVYFPETCIVSLVSTASGGGTVETAMVGSEGAVGLTEACASGRAGTDGVVQMDGRAWRAPSDLCRKLFCSDPEAVACAWRLAEFQLSETRQSCLCNTLHPVEARCSRWLLETHHLSRGRERLPLTQEFLATMLGVQRTTVSTFASQLQEAGLISYSRGQLKIVDECGLEKRACECHQIIRSLRARFLTP